MSGGASQPLLVGHKCVTGGAQAIKLGHTYINEVGHTQIQVGHRPHLAPPSRRLWLYVYVSGADEGTHVYQFSKINLTDTSICKSRTNSYSFYSLFY